MLWSSCGCSQGKWCDWTYDTYRWIEESKYKEMRHATLETGGWDSAKTGKGGWASWTAQALFAWTRTHDEPGKSGTFGYIAAGLLCADVSFTHRALARFWAVGAKGSHGNNRLLDACFRVFARCAKKKIFNSFTSFSRWKWFIFKNTFFNAITNLFQAQDRLREQGRSGRKPSDEERKLFDSQKLSDPTWRSFPIDWSVVRALPLKTFFCLISFSNLFSFSFFMPCSNSKDLFLLITFH